MTKQLRNLILFIFLSLPSLMFSTHIVGGSLTYVYNGGSSYTITLKLFRDCSAGTASFPGTVNISVLGYNGQPFTPSRDITMSLGPVTPVPSNLPPCAQQPTPMPCTQQGIYTTTVNNLPPNPGGYHMYYQIVARNLSLTNVNASGNNIGESFYAYIPGNSVNWLENFTFANGTTVDNGTTAWSTSAGVPAPASASVNGNTFQITGADNASQTWTSQSINIAAFTSGVNMSVNLSESGTLEATDSIMVYYQVNGGPLIPFATNGVITDDFGNAIASQSNIIGNTIRIIIRVHYSTTSPNSEIYNFDNVTLFQNDFIANSNPTFTIFPPLFLCVNTPFTFDHSATDIDNDSLVYEFYTPYNGENNAGPLDPTFTNNTAVFTPITFLPGYSTTAPLGGAPLTLNPSTGLLSGTPPLLGQFVVGILVKEYRDGVLISSTLRDFQFNVVNCPQTLAVTIGPQNPTICFGGTATTITANATGGTPPYSYLWNNVNPSQSLQAGVGTFSVTVTDAAGCQVFAFVNVTAFPSAITANIGPDVNRCNQIPIATLTGTVTAASGGLWSGGTGTFSPNTTTIANVQYTPSAAEITAGFTELYLTTTGNGTCPADRDTIRINYAPFQGTVTPTATPITCFGNTNGSATVAVTGGNAPFTYVWTTAPSQTTQTISNLGIGTYSVTITDATGCTSQTNATITQPAQLNVSTSVTTGGCAAGNISTTVSGGTAPYTYLWAPGGQTTSSLTSVPTGVYTVTVTDARGCQRTVTANNTQPLPITASVVGVGTSCFGGNNGTANSTVSGGTSPYTYSWSGSGATSANVTGLTAGNYTVTVTDTRSCSTTATVTITQPTVLSATTNVVNETCSYSNNGSATAVPTGGTSPYTYLWQSGGQTSISVSNLASGTYTVTVTDSRGCNTNAFAVITEPAVLTSTFGSQTNVSCLGGTNGSVTATGTGGTPAYTYNWMPGNINNATATGLTAGVYTVTVTDSRSCTGQGTVTITQPAAALSVNATVTNTSCFGGSNGTIVSTPSGGTSPYTYSWIPGGQTTATVNGLANGSYTVNVTDSRGCLTSGNYTVNQPTPIVVNLSGTAPSCFASTNGSIVSSVSGGNPSYTYTWSPGNTHASDLSNINNGTYTLTVRDNSNCSATATLTITRPPNLTATTTKTNETCDYSDDGTATVSPVGGTAPYTYSWSPSSQTTITASNLAAGIHTVTVTDNNGCIRTVTATITQPSPISISFINQINVRCFGGSTGSVRAVGAGGTPNYTYSWAPNGATTSSINGLAAGVYTVTVTDTRGCQAQAEVTITQPLAPLSVSATSTPALCFGSANGTASALPSGGTSPYVSFTWTPGNIVGQNITNLTAGNYTVTVRDNLNCAATGTVAVAQPSQIVPVLSSNGAVCGNPNGDASAVVSGGTAPYTYQWFPTGGTGSTTTPIGAGSYTVLVTDANNCTGSQSTNVNNTSGPTASIFAVTNVSCNGGNDGSASVGVVGGFGTLVYQWLPSGGNAPVASGLTAGVYTVSVTDANGCQSLATTSPPISEPPAITAEITTSAVDCFGNATGSAIGAAQGGTGTLDYLWLPSNTTGTTISNQLAGTYTLQITDDNNCALTKTYTITEPSAALSVSVSATPALCFGSFDGTTSSVASGGTSPYSYTWMPGNISSQNLGGLNANTYSVNVTDANGCNATNSISVTQPTIVSLITSTNNSTCGNSNGTASVTASGGSGTYTYFWIPDNQTTSIITGAPSGSYTVLVNDGNNCSATANLTVNNTSGPIVSIASITNVNCNGGSDGTATTNVIGGTGTIDYLWQPSGGTGSVGTGLGTGEYTVTVTDDNGCQSTAITADITQPDLISINVITSDVGCFGGNTGTASVTTAGGTPGYTYVWLPSNTTGSTINGLSAATYTVQATDTKNCIQTQSFTITQPVSALNVSMSSTSVSCFAGNNGTATALVTGGTSPYSYLWNPTGSAVSTEINLTAGTYSVTVTDFNGCTTNGSVSVQQPSQALSAVGTNGATSCFNGSDGSAFVTPNGGTANYTYLWLPSGGTAQTASGLSAGNYIIEITDANNCETSTSITITQPTQISGTLSIIDASCGLANGVVNSQLSGGTSPYTYSWSNGVTNNSSITNLVPGTYSLQVTDAQNCIQTFTTSLVNIPGPTVSASASTPVSCFGGTNGTASIIITQGTAPYTINWLPSGGITANATGLAAGTYTAVVTDNLGCVNSSAITTITEPGLLSIGISNVTDVSCNAGNNASVTVTALGGTPNYTYSWLPITSSSPTISNITAGTYTVNVVDQNACSTSISILVEEPTQLTSSLSSSTNPLCFDGLGSASVMVSGGTIPYSYSWNTSPIQTGSSALDIPAGNYTATITDANGCIVTTNAILTQPAQIITTAGPNTIVCLGNSTSLTASATGGSGTYQYTWVSPAALNNGTLTFTPTETITYTVTAYDQNNCQGTSDTLTATVYDLNAGSIDVVADTLICPNASTGVFAQINGAPGPVTITWNNLLPNGPGAFIVTPTQPTTYIATVTNQCGAMVIDSIRVKFNPPPTISLLTDTTSICVPGSLDFTDASITGNVNDPINSWVWNFGDGTFSNLQNPSHQYTSPGSYNVSLTVTTLGGCTNNNNSAPVTIFGYPIPTAAFTINSSTLNLPADQLICTNQSSGGATSYNWNFGDGSTSTLLNPQHLYNVVGNFQIQLIASNQFGCSDTATREVTTDADVIFPNVFSPSTSGPNGGAYNLNNTDNNVFFPYTAGVSEYKMQIFNRWGELIFESNDINIGWDGYYRGVICPQDVYVWKAYMKLNNGKTFNKTGDVTLLQ